MKVSRKRAITPGEFNDLAGSLVGLPVSRAWRGHGTALFLELGVLSPAEPPARQPADADPSSDQGEASVMIQWSWRVERPRSIEAGSWSTDARVDAAIARLVGPQLASISVEGRLPELVLGLSDGRWLRSFMTAEGQPQWTVFLRDGSWLTVAKGRIVHDTQNREPAVSAHASVT